MACVLIVDDDSDVRLLVRRILERHGYVVREAADGEAALQSFLDAPADIVVTDIDLPRLNGLELIAALRRWGAAVPMLAMSGCVAESAVEMLYSSVMQGANGFLAKPFTAEELARLVSEMLAMHSASVQLIPGAATSGVSPAPRNSDSQGQS